VRASNTVRVHLAGQTALNSAGQIVGDGIVEQFEQALGNLLTALAAAGGQPGHLASVTIYLVDLADYRSHAREIGAVWRRLAGTEYPAMAGIGVARLWDDAALVELQGVAELP
jgi:enamine deaminase RidA (YjgF/YER057c/UK114 family)